VRGIGGGGTSDADDGASTPVESSQRVPVISTRLVASVDVVPSTRNRFLVFYPLSSLIVLPPHQNIYGKV
jgi:hypothetical protein